MTNVRETGLIKVQKVYTGDVAGASTDFTVHVDCLGDAYDQDVALNKDNDWTNTTNPDKPIPTGVECTLTEVKIPAGWQQVGAVSPEKVTVAEGTPAEASATVTNSRTTGVITVAKSLVGAANGASTSFTFDVVCEVPGYNQSLTIDVTNGESGKKTTTPIPTGVSCTVTERTAPDWRQTAVVPANGVVTAGSTVTFTNTRLQGQLKLLKEVSPVAGNGVVVEFGDTLTYTLTASATGEQRQPNAVVRDYLPGYDPTRPTSGKTTYVAGSAACIGAGACTVTGPDANGLITWQLGEMAAGTSRQVTFQVTIDDVTGAAGTTVAEDILNAGEVQSDRTPATPSNEVSTPVSKVLPVKVSKPPAAVLPHTGAALPIGPLVGCALALMGIGLLMLTASRRRGWTVHR